MTEQFDVFLAHSSKDKPLIRQIYRQLKARGMRPWLDEEEIAPGTKFQDEIQQAIGQIKTAAIFIGHHGFGPWQLLELKAFISQCVRRDIPVIPVLLPGAPAIPENLLFLQEFHAVAFEDDIADERALFRLEWGITGRKPEGNKAIAVETPKPGTPTPNDDLASEKGVDYGRLRDFLKAGQWKEADQETADRMLEAIAQKVWFVIGADDLLNFPCADLKTIDHLWVKYSAGQFGFSIQKKIYSQCGSELDFRYLSNEVQETFYEQLGWRVDSSYISYRDVTFDASAKVGHLPCQIWGELGAGPSESPFRAVRLSRFSTLISRFTMCEL